MNNSFMLADVVAQFVGFAQILAACPVAQVMSQTPVAA